MRDEEPQAAVQVGQVQSLTRQSCGQAGPEQLRVSLSAGHERPPPDGCCVTVRVHEIDDVLPHAAVQLVQL